MRRTNGSLEWIMVTRGEEVEVKFNLRAYILLKGQPLYKKSFGLNKSGIEIEYENKIEGRRCFELEKDVLRSEKRREKK